MGEAKRTTKLRFNFDARNQGGMNTGKREYLESTARVLNQARAFYVDFFLAHHEKLKERVSYFSEKHNEQRERLISADELLTWAEIHTVQTKDHINPLPDWNFSHQFNVTVVYRRCVIKDAIGKVRSYLSHLRNFKSSGKTKGKPGIPTATNHPTLYKGTIELHLEELDYTDSFVKIKVYTGKEWIWENYPVYYSVWHNKRLQDTDWQTLSPKLVLRANTVELHIPQTKKVKAIPVKESKQNSNLVTVAVDLNVKNLAVITVRQNQKIIKTLFFKDKGLDCHRYRHMKRVTKHQWQSGKPIKGEHANRLLWNHVRRTNQDFAHKSAKVIACVCGDYPGCVLIFENLRKMGNKGESKSHRLNRKLANQIRGKIRDYARYKAFIHGTVTVEVNPHGTSQYCSCCGKKGERFSYQNHKRIKHKGGKLFYCPHCGYEANADFNASVNLHHSFYKEFHWQPGKKKNQAALLGYRPSGISIQEGHPNDRMPCPHANEHAGKVVGL